MKDIWINRQSTLVYTPVDRQEFYARKVSVTDEQKAVIDEVMANYKALSKWAADSYAGLNTRNEDKMPAFPEELDSGEDKQKANPSKKSGTKKRVRDGSSGDAKAAGGEV